MKLRMLSHTPWLLSFLAMIMIPLFFTIGCEDGQDSVESFFGNDTVDTSGRSVSTNRPYISPLSVTLDTDGMQAVFTGHEGRGPYSWSVSDESRGSIRVDGDSQALYTRLSQGNNTVVLHDQQGHWAAATINQGDVATPLAVSPTSCTLAGTTNATVLTASGGTPPYTWSVGYNSGYVNPSAGNNTVYTRTDYSGNDNIVWCHDSGSGTAYATIYQD